MTSPEPHGNSQLPVTIVASTLAVPTVQISFPRRKLSFSNCHRAAISNSDGYHPAPRARFKSLLVVNGKTGIRTRSSRTTHMAPADDESLSHRVRVNRARREIPVPMCCLRSFVTTAGAVVLVCVACASSSKRRMPQNIRSAEGNGGVDYRGLAGSSNRNAYVGVGAPRSDAQHWQDANNGDRHRTGTSVVLVRLIISESLQSRVETSTGVAQGLPSCLKGIELKPSLKVAFIIAKGTKPNLDPSATSQFDSD
ncbi:hypothetical protein FB451DRAFT_1377728 [Mycena latifolia]|nr:hypothetical protein FB451DRAFT_1377728 [Mycena latifolia]